MTDTKQEHTPLPWHIHQTVSPLNGKPCVALHAEYEKDGKHRHHYLGTCDLVQWNGEMAANPDANAEFIVTACNAYYDNQQTIRELIKGLESQIVLTNEICHPHDGPIADEAIKALNKAKDIT